MSLQQQKQWQLNMVDIQFFLCLAFAVRIDSFEINKCPGFLGNLGERS